MRIVETHSVRDAESLLRQRGALEPCLTVARCSPADLKDNEFLGTLGFVAEWSFDAGGNRPRFDAYSQQWRVGIEREMCEQMNVRSHLLFAEIAFQKGIVGVCVFILPMKGQGTFDRTVREVTKYDLFTKYFPLQVPLFLIGCD